MSKINVSLASSLAIILLTIGIGIGYYLTPQYNQRMTEKIMELGPADRLVDLRYVNAMIAHHRGAILLAKQAEKSQRTEIQSLAKEIQSGETKLIDELYAWKKEWYGDTRNVRDLKVANLGSFDKNFDLRFLNALIAHHELGIAMTKEIRLKSSRNKVLDNADAVQNFLETTLQTFRSWRSEWYNVK